MSNSHSPKPGPLEKPANEVGFHFSKGPDFRRLRADGAWLAMGPQQLVHLTFFADNPFLPRTVRVMVDDDGKSLSQAVETSNQPNEFEREAMVDVVVTIDTVRKLKDLLEQNMDAIDKLMESKQ